MKKGLTIIEVLISIVVVTAVFAGVMAGLYLAGNIAWHNIHKTGAINRAQEKIEEIKNALGGLWGNISGYDGETEQVVIYSGKTDSADDNTNATRTVDIIWRDETGASVSSPDEASFAEVKVNVTWNVLPEPYQETIEIVTNMTVHN